VHTLDVAWGETVTTEQVGAALEAHPTTRLVGIVHAETSTGAHQPLEDISRRVHEAGALLLVDAVTSLGGIELRVDDWQIDACYSGTQKCLSCPPGLAPITFSVAAEEKLASRKHPVQSWYFDLSLIQSYWGGQRTYHHTAPINMTYGLHEALAIVLEEGLDARFARHDLNHRALRAGVLALGLDYIPARSLTTLNAITVPAGVDDAQVRARLLADWGIEIGAGLGPFAGKAWRVGLMGEGSCRRSVDLLLGALETLLVEQGAAVDRGAALAAAAGIYN
jgi:alanine-glyoxylate transaminase/serine-glyoxylate transaminase/serine-pyruvate transaminase